MAQQQNLFETEPEPWELAEQDERLVATIVFSETPYGPYDYLVPDRLRSIAEAGRRVRVPFGKGNRSVIGYCVQVENRTERGRRLKEVNSFLDEQRLLSSQMLKLTKWMAEYYLCEWGQAIETAVPAGVRGKAGTREVAFLTVPTNVAERMTQLKLPPKQAAALKILAASTQEMTAAQLAAAAKCTEVPINSLRKKGLIEAETRRVHVDEHEIPVEAREQELKLNTAQQTALQSIIDALDSRRHQTVLLHGITGSGKTEVYIRAIQHVISFGRQAIVLVPEISLTPQTRQRFRSRFDNVAVLHSNLRDSERYWHWERIARGEVQVIVGARSAVFAPTPNLGLIVIDEEHDNSFKQDNVPRYHARDVAVHRTQSEDIPLVLGTATPSLESWHRAKENDYRIVEMPHRVLDRTLPDVTTIDLRTEYQSSFSRGAVSRPLHAAINDALQNDGQVILLLNRRGHSTIIQCPSCGYVARCQECEIALTHHRIGEKAVCHYCDYQIDAPAKCPECQFDGIRYSGLGTQRLESEVRARFPGIECLRMDSDSMQQHGSHERALDRFRAGEVKILLGTQMIAKGLDFPNVTLVGVINADTALHFPDFRAAERTFQLVTQVAGRTGRGDKGGRVIVQTFSPDHPAILAAIKHDYQMFADQELPARKSLGYPPSKKMIRLVVRGSSESETEEYCDRVTSELQTEIKSMTVDGRILGPAPAPISKLRGKFRFHTLLMGDDRDAIRDAVRAVTSRLKPLGDVQLVIDVDPMDML